MSRDALDPASEAASSLSRCRYARSADMPCVSTRSRACSTLTALAWALMALYSVRLFSPPRMRACQVAAISRR